MRYFTLIDFQHWVLALVFGLLIVIYLFVAWRLYPDPEEGEGVDVERLHTGHTIGSHPPTPFLILLYIGAILWAIGYAVIEGVLGGAIG